jgi:DNA-binding NtrC family response regulator
MNADAPGAPEAPSPRTILVVDDEKNIRRTLDLVLSGEGYRVLLAETGGDALRALESPTEPIDLVLLDVKLPDVSGLDVLERLRRDDATASLPIIVISGHAGPEEAVQAIRLGASDFFEKPLARERVLVSVRNALEAADAKRALVEARGASRQGREMVGESRAMQRLWADVEKVAPTRASVLITGESGTGKELVARAIHARSARASGPFVKVNCAAIPRELIESELFGHEKGAFTGAQARKRGLFEQAHGGTIFLDEIGDMDPIAQAKVLRALQSGEIARVGAERAMHVDVRVLAATNKDLSEEVRRGTFREDLLFRLDVFPIRTPPLRERLEDIPALAHAFLAAFCEENGARPKTIAKDVLDALSRRRWPGNVRELRNVIERMAILASGDVLTIAELPEDPHASPFDDGPAAEPGGLDTAASEATAEAGHMTAPMPAGYATLREHRDRAERDYIVATLELTGWNVSRTAVLLGVERTNLHKKIRAYGIKRGA